MLFSALTLYKTELSPKLCNITYMLSSQYDLILTVFPLCLTGFAQDHDLRIKELALVVLRLWRLISVVFR